MSLNRTVLVGRLTRDPDLRYTPNGVAVTNFTLAVNRPFKQDGQQQADFINCVTWRKQAESLANYMQKGSQVGVDGRLQTRTYEDKDGKTVFVTEVLAESIQFLESKGSQGNSGDSQPMNQQNNSNQTNKSTGASSNNSNPFEGVGDAIDIEDDELPF